MPIVSADSHPQENLHESFWAFISFVSEDLPWCDWLYITLHGYPVPPALAVQSTRFGFPLPDSLSAFPDPNDPAHVDQQGAVLGGAKYLILVVSPHSASTTQMDHHIRAFKRAGGEERIIALVVEGQPAPTSSLCVRSSNYDWLPDWLAWRLEPDGRFRDGGPREPLVIDARPGFSNLDEVMTSLISTLLDVPRQEFEVIEAVGPHDAETAKASVLSAKARSNAAAMTDPSEALLSCVQIPESAPGVRDWRSAGIALLFLSCAFLILGCIGGVVFLRNCDVPRWKPNKSAAAPAPAPVHTPELDREVAELRLQTQAAIGRAELQRDRHDIAGSLESTEAAIRSATRLQELTNEGEALHLMLGRLYRAAGQFHERMGRKDEALRAFESSRVELVQVRATEAAGEERASLIVDVEAQIARLNVQGGELQE